MIGIRRSSPERLGGDPHPGRGLAALVLGQVDQAHHPGHQLLVEARFDQLAGGQVALHVGLEDRVEHLVGRQALVVALVGAQLGRRRLGQHRLGDDRRRRELRHAAQPVDQGLGHVLDHREAAGRVAVEGRVAHRRLALVAGGEDHPAELVGQGHEQDAPDPALQVLLGQVRSRPAKLGASMSRKAAWAASIGMRAVVDPEAARPAPRRRSRTGRSSSATAWPPRGPDRGPGRRRPRRPPATSRCPRRGRRPRRGTRSWSRSPGCRAPAPGRPPPPDPSGAAIGQGSRGASACWRGASVITVTGSGGRCTGGPGGRAGACGRRGARRCRRWPPPRRTAAARPPTAGRRRRPARPRRRPARPGRRPRCSTPGCTRRRRPGWPAWLRARSVASGVVGRGVDVDHQLGARRGLGGDRARRGPRRPRRSRRRPAPRRSDTAAPAPPPGREVALLVEHAVVGQALLVVDAADLAVGAHARRRCTGRGRSSTKPTTAAQRAAAPPATLARAARLSATKPGLSSRSSGG